MQTNFELDNDRWKNKSVSEKVRDENYKELQENTNVLCFTQQKVFNCICNYPSGVCDKQISEDTGLPVSTVCGRRNELMKMGIVTSVGYDYFPDYTGRMRKNTLFAERMI